MKNQKKLRNKQPHKSTRLKKKATLNLQPKPSPLAKKKAPVRAKTAKAKYLTDLLWVYVEPANGAFARKKGKKEYGSFSSYLNSLIAKDRGVKARQGIWQAK